MDFNTADGTAVSGLDYQATGGTLTFAPNEIVKTFDVILVNNALAEPDETVLLTLSNPQGGTNGALGSAAITIFDDDLQFNFNLVGTNVVAEAVGNAVYVVTKGPFASQAPASVVFAVSSPCATAAALYRLQKMSFKFPSPSKQITNAPPLSAATSGRRWSPAGTLLTWNWAVTTAPVLS